MTFKIFSMALIAASLLLAGCGKENSDTPVGASATTVSIAAIEAEAKGFTVGSAISTRTVYVFFDSQCPHCTALWYSAKPLLAQARFVWIPVGVLNPSSTAQGATILAAADPVAAMNEHEAAMLAQRGGISAASDIDAQKKIVSKNTDLLTRFGFASIPTIIARHAQSGDLVTQEGSLPTAALATLLGLRVPDKLPEAATK